MEASLRLLLPFLEKFNNFSQPIKLFSEDTGQSVLSGHTANTHTHRVPVLVSVFDEGREGSKASVRRWQEGGHGNYYTRGKNLAVNNS